MEGNSDVLFFVCESLCVDYQSLATTRTNNTKMLIMDITLNSTKGDSIVNIPMTAVISALIPIMNEPFIADAEPANSLNGDKAAVTVFG